MPILTYFNPLTTLTLPILLFFSLPVALFAALTTTLALSILLFRVTLLYIELAITVLPSYLLTPKPSNTSKPVSPPRHRRRRRSSSVSGGSLTPTGLLTSPNSVHSLTSYARDFEGVGGWRLDNPNSEEEEALWTKINSRLELPSEHGRRHKRSLTSEGMLMNTGRARTVREDGYFGGQGQVQISPKSERQGSPKAGRKRTPSAGTGSSGSSRGSVLSMKGR